MNNCEKCKIEMHPFSHDGKEFDVCPRCRVYFGEGHRSKKHPRQGLEVAENPWAKAKLDVPN